MILPKVSSSSSSSQSYGFFLCQYCLWLWLTGELGKHYFLKSCFRTVLWKSPIEMKFKNADKHTYLWSHSTFMCQVYKLLGNSKHNTVRLINFCQNNCLLQLLLLKNINTFFNNLLLNYLITFSIFLSLDIILLLLFNKSNKLLKAVLQWFYHGFGAKKTSLMVKLLTQNKNVLILYFSAVVVIDALERGECKRSTLTLIKRFTVLLCLRTKGCEVNAETWLIKSSYLTWKLRRWINPSRGIHVPDVLLRKDKALHINSNSKTLFINQWCTQYYSTHQTNHNVYVCLIYNLQQRWKECPLVCHGQ